jgi:DNA-binding response OmpR family regulator
LLKTTAARAQSGPGRWAGDGNGEGKSGQEPDAAHGHCAEPLLGRRILIVEDEAMLALDLEWAIDAAGAQVIGPAMTLDEALGIIARGEPIDAAVLDVDLAGRSVLPVARQLAEAGVPFLFHTGHGDRTALLDAFPRARMLIKPQLTERLIAELVALIG